MERKSKQGSNRNQKNGPSQALPFFGRFLLLDVTKNYAIRLVKRLIPVQII